MVEENDRQVGGGAFEGFGQAEEIVGKSLQTLGIARKDVVLATKFEHATGTGPNDGGGSRVHIVEAVKASLKRLGTDHIDLYQMHGWDPATPVEETVRALDDLVRQGLVRYVGVSSWAAWQVSTALGVADALGASHFQAYQGYYSLAGRDIEREVTPMIEAYELGLLVFSPLAGGYLTGKYRDKTDGRRATIPFPPVDETKGIKVLEVMDGIAASHETTLEAVALAWLRQKPVVGCIITGVTSLEQLNANLATVALTLTDREVAALNDVGTIAPEYPGWMLAQGSAARASLMATGVMSEAY
nr:aldo/keto reductase [Thalassospira lohafexi]